MEGQTTAEAAAAKKPRITMSTTHNSLQSLIYERGSLQVIDQLKLPHELEFLPVRNADDAWSVIRTMQVRGAPLIAIVAALGLAVEAHTKKGDFSRFGYFLFRLNGYSSL